MRITTLLGWLWHCSVRSTDSAAKIAVDWQGRGGEQKTSTRAVVDVGSQFKEWILVQ